MPDLPIKSKPPRINHHKVYSTAVRGKAPLPSNPTLYDPHYKASRPTLSDSVVPTCETRIVIILHLLRTTHILQPHQEIRDQEASGDILAVDDHDYA